MKAREDIINLYVQEEWRNTQWKKFRQICEREGISASAKIRQFIEDYNSKHEPGNPQTRMDIIMTLGQAYKAKSCLDCNKPPRYEALVKGVKVFFCEKHLNARKHLPKANAKSLQSWRELTKK